ncbi:MAG: serine hydrolase [Candidatus Uhrbacteria bacterium]
MVAFLAAIFIAAQAAIIHPAIGAMRPLPVLAEFVRVPVPPLPEKIKSGDVEELGPIIDAEAAVVVDAASGAVLFGKRPYAVRPLASITKLLTALAVVRADLDVGRKIAILSADIPVEGGTVLTAGDHVSIDDLFTALLVRSDNGAARALARTMVAKSTGAATGDPQKLAVERMRTLALSLDLRTVRIADVAGLDPGNVGAPIDAARLMIAAMVEPKIRSRSMIAEATISGGQTGRERIAIQSTNRLLRDLPPRSFDVVGGKTGHIDESGYNFAIAAARDGHRIAIVVLGSTTDVGRFRDARALADWTFRNYEWND